LLVTRVIVISSFAVICIFSSFYNERANSIFWNWLRLYYDFGWSNTAVAVCVVPSTTEESCQFGRKFYYWKYIMYYTLVAAAFPFCNYTLSVQFVDNVVVLYQARLLSDLNNGFLFIKKYFWYTNTTRIDFMLVYIINFKQYLLLVIILNLFYWIFFWTPFLSYKVIGKFRRISEIW